MEGGKRVGAAARRRRPRRLRAGGGMRMRASFRGSSPAGARARRPETRRRPNRRRRARGRREGRRLHPPRRLNAGSRHQAGTPARRPQASSSAGTRRRPRARGHGGFLECWQKHPPRRLAPPSEDARPTTSGILERGDTAAASSAGGHGGFLERIHSPTTYVLAVDLVAGVSSGHPMEEEVVAMPVLAGRRPWFDGGVRAVGSPLPNEFVRGIDPLIPNESCGTVLLPPHVW